MCWGRRTLTPTQPHSLALELFCSCFPLHSQPVPLPCSVVLRHHYHYCYNKKGRVNLAVLPSEPLCFVLFVASNLAVPLPLEKVSRWLPEVSLTLFTGCSNSQRAASKKMTQISVFQLKGWGGEAVRRKEMWAAGLGLICSCWK